MKHSLSADYLSLYSIASLVTGEDNLWVKSLNTFSQTVLVTKYSIIAYRCWNFLLPRLYSVGCVLGAEAPDIRHIFVPNNLKPVKGILQLRREDIVLFEGYLSFACILSSCSLRQAPAGNIFVFFQFFFYNYGV